MRKIIHVISGLNVGGAELMLKRLILCSNRNSNNFEHIVISLTSLGAIGPQLQEKGVTVYQLEMKTFLSTPIAFYKLRELLKQLQPDVVQTWMYHADFLGGLAAKSMGITNIIWGIRTTDISQGSSKTTIYLSKLCAKLSYVIPNTIVCAAHVSKNYHVGIGYDETKITVIPNGFDLQALTATEEEGLKIRYQNNLTKDDIIIGSVGRFNAVKNQKLFIEIAEELVKEIPNIKFIMVGRDNTLQNPKLIKWIKSRNLETNFRLLGERSDIPQCLKAMDILCVHSKTEGFPNVVGEALLLNKCVLSTDVGDIHYLLDNQFILESRPIAFVNRIKQLIESNTYKDNKSINSLSMKVSKEFNLDNCVANFEALYYMDSRFI